MKRFSSTIILILTVVFAAAIFPQEHWHSLSSPTDKLLRNLFFIDSLTGWCAGQGGTIIRTTDGGINWVVQNSGVEWFIVDIFFINENVGWALTIKETPPFGTIILSTTNGGDEWLQSDYPEINVFMNAVFFLDSLNGFLGGSVISRTTDGGITWAEANIDSNLISGLPVYNFDFYSRQFGYACGGFIDMAGVVWKTTDYGLNWSATGVSPDQIFDLYVIDSLNAIALSGDPEGFFGTGDIKTTDAGETWSYDILSFFGLSFAIDFRTESEAWSASGFKFLCTTNKGIEWLEKSVPDIAVIFDLQFTDSYTGYASGENGVILKYERDPSAIIEAGSNNPVLNFDLQQNYPNPFNPLTTIKYSIAEFNLVVMKIFDVLGNEITTLVNEEKPAGYYEVEFNPAAITGYPSSGIYFYQLTAGSFSKTRKMIYLK